MSNTVVGVNWRGGAAAEGSGRQCVAAAKSAKMVPAKLCCWREKGKQGERCLLVNRKKKKALPNPLHPCTSLFFNFIFFIFLYIFCIFLYFCCIFGFFTYIKKLCKNLFFGQVDHKRSQEKKHHRPNSNQVGGPIKQWLKLVKEHFFERGSNTQWA